VTLTVVAPSALTIVSGSAPTYAITGGKPPYSAASGNSGVAVPTVNGNSITVAGMLPGTASIAVFDAAGASASLAVTVNGGSIALYTTAQSAVTVGLNSPVSFNIGGGVAPYTVSSSNSTAVAVSASGSTLSIVGLAGGSATVVVRDAVGATATTNVTVGSATTLYSTLPSPLTVGLGMTTSSYRIAGGTPPYTVTAANPSVVKLNLTGNSLSILGAASGTSRVTIFDAIGASVSSDVTVSTVSAASPLYLAAPSSVTIQSGSTANYMIGGGAGGYIATSSNVAVVTAAVSGSTLTVTGVGHGAANVAITDQAGVQISLAVTVP
jgi:hypothetical protein